MSKGMAHMPVVSFSEREIMSGELPGLLARAAIAQGPVLKHVARYGSGDSEEFVYLVGPEANRLVLHTQREDFSHDLGWTPIIGESLGKGLLTMDGLQHTRHRKMWNPAFTASYMEAYLPLVQGVIAARTARWLGQESIDLWEEAREITFEVAATALAGLPRGPQVDRLRTLFYTLLHGGSPDETWEHYVETMLNARDTVTRLLVATIAERRAAGDERPGDVLGLIVRARDEDGAALSDEQILAHVNILLVAGHETTTTLGAWVLYLLATRPQDRARIQAELAILPHDSAGDLSIESLRGAHQLDAFIREAGRLYAPVINVPRGTVRAVEFGGYTIPAGVQVRLALAAGHLLPTVFDDPSTFDMDRFLAPRDEDRRTPYALVTFGGGSRICIGINFAQIEVKALVAHVLPRYALEPLTTTPPPHAGHWTAILPGGLPMRARRAE